MIGLSLRVGLLIGLHPVLNVVPNLILEIGVIRALRVRVAGGRNVTWVGRQGRAG